MVFLSQAVQHGVLALVKHFPAAGAQPRFVDPELPADGLDGLLGSAVETFFDFADRRFAHADFFTKLLHGQAQRLADGFDSFIHRYHLLSESHYSTKVSKINLQR